MADEPTPENTSCALATHVNKTTLNKQKPKAAFEFLVMVVSSAYKDYCSHIFLL